MGNRFQEEINELHRMKKQLSGAQGCSVKTQERNDWKAKCLSLAINALYQVGSPAPENKPLTLEQLRQMDGEPVKVVEDGEYQYGIVSLSGHFLAPKEEAITLCSGNFYLLREMVGNFQVYPVAYASKPEQEDKP